MTIASTETKMSPDVAARMDALYAQFTEALRTDIGVLEDLARAAARAAAARDARIAQPVLEVRGRCGLCRRPGHNRRSCTAAAARDERVAQPEVRGSCGVCRQSGHNRRSCPASR